jgi:hypothetical protein
LDDPIVSALGRSFRDGRRLEGIRSVTWETARMRGVAPERVSFVDALRWLGGCDGGPGGMALWVNPERPGRAEPRVRKRRPKQWPRMMAPRSELRKRLRDNEDAAWPNAIPGVTFLTVVGSTFFHPVSWRHRGDARSTRLASIRGYTLLDLLAAYFWLVCVSKGGHHPLNHPGLNRCFGLVDGWGPGWLRADER